MKNSMRNILVISLLVTAGLTMPGRAADAARMEQVIQVDAADNQFMGAVLVARGDTILLDKGYGAANLEWNIPDTPATRFRIGSLAKQFTAAAILLLEERGKLKLGDPVRTYLPNAPAAWDRITLFNLLTQTSGIHDYTDTPEFGIMMKRQMTPEQLIATFRDSPLEFAASEKFSYSNSNYVLLASVIEKISGMPYARFLQDNIFTPLGMKDSGYDSAAVLPRRASGYARKDGAVVNASYRDVSIQYGAGALYSTTHDLLTWEKALFDGKVLSPASLKKMMTPFRDARGPGVPYKAGYGMGVYAGTTADGRREISHTGSDFGFVSMMAAYPDDRLFVILLSNIETTPYANIARKLTDVAFGKAVILPSERKEVAVNAKLLPHYVGRYQVAPTVVTEITQVDGALYMQVDKQPRVPIFPQGDTSFFSRSVDAQVDFQAAGDGPAPAIILHMYGKDVTWRRIP